MSTPCNAEGNTHATTSIDRTRPEYEKERVRRINTINKRFQGPYVEAIASKVVVSHLGLYVDPKFTPRNTGIDLFCRGRGGKITIVEVKGAQKGLSALSHAQNSIEWIYTKAQEMANSGIPGNVELGNEILSIPRSQAESKIDRVVITGQWVGEGKTDYVIGMYDGVGSGWDEIGSFSGIDIDQPMLDPGI
jgi:hypothetical protein